MAGRRKYGTHLDLQGNRLYNEGTLVPSSLTSLVFDFADEVDNLQAVTVGVLTLCTFSTANLAAGRRKEVLITTSQLAVTKLAFPAAWKWYGGILSATVLSKEIRLTLVARGPTDADVRAEFTTQV